MGYMPQHIFNTIPSMNYKGFRIINTNVMVIDKLRVITDPITSYWRLDKDLCRLIKL
jgi:hypothetical protein